MTKFVSTTIPGNAGVTFDQIYGENEAPNSQLGRGKEKVDYGNTFARDTQAGLDFRHMATAD